MVWQDGDPGDLEGAAAALHLREVEVQPIAQMPDVREKVRNQRLLFNAMLTQTCHAVILKRLCRPIRADLIHRFLHSPHIRPIHDCCRHNPLLSV